MAIPVAKPAAMERMKAHLPAMPLTEKPHPRGAHGASDFLSDKFAPSLQFVDGITWVAAKLYRLLNTEF
jgi:hypothetical protein